MASRRRIIIKICLFLQIVEVLLGSVLSVFSFLLQNAAEVGLADTPSWLGIPCALFGLFGISIIVLNKLKKELVFVVVFHILIIGLCILSLILITPKIGKWQPVSNHQISGICRQLEYICNCTKPLPTRVYRCIDLIGVYDLIVIISVIVGLCLANSVFAAYFDLVIIKQYAPQDDLRSSVIGVRNPYDEEQLVNSFGELGHIGPLNSPELDPRASDVIVNSIFLNRNEYRESTQEKEIEGIENSMGSSASVPADKTTVEAKSIQSTAQVKAPSIPNSANGSKQSIRSRKDTLLKRLNSVQSRSLDDPEDGNDDTMLHELEKNSRHSSNINLNGSADVVRTSPRITQDIDSSSRYNDGTKKNDMLLAEKLASLLPLERSLGKSPGKVRMNETDLSQRSYSEINILGKSSNTGNENDKGTSQRSRSEGNVLDIGNLDNKMPNSDRVPEKNDEIMTVVPSILNKNSLDNNNGILQENFTGHVDQHAAMPPSRRTGNANSMLRGLPPLPLKETQFNLTVQERTFSAPALPFIDSLDRKFGRDRSIRRPGSSGSQIIADRKKEFAGQVRNALIDDQTLSNENKTIRSGVKVNADAISDVDSERRNSFDTNSTDIDIDDKVEGSEVFEDFGKKPRWHPPWQLKQEIIAHKESIPVLAIEPRNRWFASGSTDRSMKIWDIKNGNCRLTVKVHKSGIRALAFGSTGHRFIFSAADDRQLICTDIEVNKIVAHYPDQSSVIYAMAMYRPAELLVTCGRDKYVKIWDTREKKCIKTMRGHMNTASSVAIIQNSGQIISGSHDSTMRIWDIGEGRCTQILTGHEKSVRSIYVHPEEPVISSASTERIIHWSMPDGEKIKEITPTDISINCISVNPQGALVAAGSNGVIHLWDWKSGHKFQKIHRTSVYESQEVPICVFSAAFDKSGSRLFVSDASNIIKVYGEAYTRVRRRHANTEDKDGKKDKQQKFPTPDNVYA